ncbi:MAG: 16S rRNA (guanine(966)-N(2))-methyltransferase RsmD [Deltaproteobacteria bacterium]|nr:16S rRNA (guanine(966)-N(2))-methyltransferase RsmD [Deltaproteobacteria bacterium]
MRVIAGIAKGRRLIGPKKGEPIRPVLDQVKEAIFNILYTVDGLRVLDCFAGTGAVGIEALSRGAAHATFVDHLPTACAIIERNLAHTGFTDRATTLCMSAERAIKTLAARRAVFDLVFVDPPYEKGFVNTTLAALAETSLLWPNGRIIIEHHPKEPVDPPAQYALTDRRKYGQTLITFLTCR